MQKKVEYKITIPKEILGKYKCKKYRKKKKTEFKGSFSYSCSGSKSQINLFLYLCVICLLVDYIQI